MSALWRQLKDKPLTEVRVPIDRHSILRMPAEGEESGYVRVMVGDFELTAPYSSFELHATVTGFGEIAILLPIALIEIVPEMRQ